MTWPLVWRSSYAFLVEEARHAHQAAVTAEARAIRAEELLDAVRAERIVDREEAYRRMDRSVAALHELLETERQARLDERIALNTQAADALAHMRTLLERERDEKRDIMTRFTQLRLQGAVDIPQLGPRPEPDTVKQAILAKAGKNRDLAAAMLRQAAVDRASGMDDMEILAHIENGERETFEGVPA